MALHSRLLRFRRSPLPTTMRSTLIIILVMSCISSFAALEDPVLSYLLQFGEWLASSQKDGDYRILTLAFKRGDASPKSTPAVNDIKSTCEAVRDDEVVCRQYTYVLAGKKTDDYEVWKKACSPFKVGINIGTKYDSYMGVCAQLQQHSGKCAKYVDTANNGLYTNWKQTCGKLVDLGKRNAWNWNVA